jgi:hypothetical protein
MSLYPQQIEMHQSDPATVGNTAALRKSLESADTRF